MGRAAKRGRESRALRRPQETAVVVCGFIPAQLRLLALQRELREALEFGMRVAALYDIHGNLPALEAVLSEIRSARVDRIVVGGDVLPGPMPRECLDLVVDFAIPTDFIMGNGDRETIAAKHGKMSSLIPASFRETMEWNAAQLNDADEQRINSWPLTKRFHIAGFGDVTFCHATPRNDTEIFVSTTSDEKLRPIFDPLGTDVVVCGHTHMQFDRMVGDTRVVNAGSVGMPFDSPGAYWLLIDSGIELRRTDYDMEKAADRVRRTAYPQAEDFATRSVLSPPSKQIMTEAFSKAELT
jgi:putative phosphoesterase